MGLVKKLLNALEETPKDIHKDSEDRYRTWYFPKHNFTLMMLWSRFIIVGEEQMINGSASETFDDKFQF
ncbi:hypothetical protein AAHE18_11G091100 [Arachis hypogaea]